MRIKIDYTGKRLGLMAYGADVVCWTLARDFRSMQRLALIALLCLMFCVPFVLMGARYAAAPVELPVLRVGIGHTALWATKSHDVSKISASRPARAIMRR